MQVSFISKLLKIKALREGQGNVIEAIIKCTLPGNSYLAMILVPVACVNLVVEMGLITMQVPNSIIFGIAPLCIVADKNTLIVVV